MTGIIGDQQDFSAAAEAVYCCGNYDLHFRSLPGTQRCFGERNGKAGIVDLQHLYFQRRLPLVGQENDAFEFRLPVERAQVYVCCHFCERSLRRTEFRRREVREERRRDPEFIVFVHAVAGKTRKIHTGLGESQAVQEVTFERDHQFADTAGANGRRFVR